MINIYDNANEMARVLPQTEQFIAWKTALDAIKSDAEAKKLYQKFQATQLKLQQAMQTGALPTDDDRKEFEAVAKEVQANDLINQMMGTEERLNNLLTELNQIVVGELTRSYQEFSKES